MMSDDNIYKLFWILKKKGKKLKENDWYIYILVYSIVCNVKNIESGLYDDDDDDGF